VPYTSPNSSSTAALRAFRALQTSQNLFAARCIRRSIAERGCAPNGSHFPR
jgi:hypothetical protein